MAALENILVILKSECDWDSKQERIEHLIAHESWETVRDGLYRVLLDRGLVEHAYIIASVLWAGVLDKRPLDPNLTIAVLERQRCFRPPHPSEALNSLDNLVWSIISKLKGVGYQSDYDPLQDPDVLREMKRLT